MRENCNVLAIVPARAGSKGVKDKNILKLGSRSLIGWAGWCLCQLDWIDQAVLSTDSATYAQEGERSGLLVPSLRPEELSSDSASAVDVIKHVLQQSEKSQSKVFDVILYLEPTSPFRTPKNIEECFDLLIRNNYDSVVSVSPINTKFHPLKALALRTGSDKNQLDYYEPRGHRIVARQQLDPCYMRNGIVYALTRSAVLDGLIIGPNTGAYVVNKNVVNIDDPEDVHWANFLIQNGQAPYFFN